MAEEQKTQKIPLKEAELEEINEKLDEIFLFLLNEDKDEAKYNEYFNYLVNIRGTLQLNYNRVEDLPMKTIQKLVSLDGLIYFKNQRKFESMAEYIGKEIAKYIL